MLKQILTAILLALSIQNTVAQQLRATRSHYTTKEGLCSNVITSLAQDDFGYLWIGTWNGLSRYDGYHFFNYKTGNASHVKNLHNHIHDIVIDPSQNVWMRMYDQRIFVLNRTTDQFVDPFENPKGEDDFFCSSPLIVTTEGDVLANIKGESLFRLRLDRKGLSREEVVTSQEKITCIAEDCEGGIWLGTRNGLRHLGKGKYEFDQKILLPEEHITSLHPNGFNILAATSNGKIFSISSSLEPKLIRNTAGRPIHTMFVDSHGLIWFCDNTMGALYLNPQTGKEKKFKQYVPIPEPDERGGAFNEVNGVLWVKMNYGGYGYYERETDEIAYFHNDPSNPWNLLNTVQASLELTDGIVWESTKRRGLEKLELLLNNIVRARPVPNANSTIENEIRALYYDSQRKLLLLGNKNSSLFLEYDNGQRSVITHDSEGKPFGRLYGITKDSKGNYWICSKDSGLYKMTPKEHGGWTIQHFSHQDSNKNSLNHNGAYIALTDKSGNVWVATYGGGVNLLTNNQQGEPVFIHPENGMKGYPQKSHRRVRTIEIDQDGNVWAGTTDGILILSYKNNQVNVETLKMSEEDDRMLMSNDIICIKRDSKGTMWIGTNGGGLARCIGKDGDSWNFETFSVRNGLPSEEIRSITFDQRGNPWFATERTICSLDLNTRVITSFSTLDGVDETALSENGAITLDNERLLFGTLDGYYIVDIKKLMAASGSQLKLQITDFLINEEIQSPRLNNTYNYYVPNSRSVKLPNRDCEFAFRFAALNFQLQHRVHYQYMLEGYDDEWQNADSDRMAVYSDIPAGTYSFKVKAFLLESPDKYDIRTMEVIVPSFFLFSSTAMIIYGVILVAILLLFLYKKKNKKC